MAAAALCLLLPRSASADAGSELAGFELFRADDGLYLDYAVDFELPRELIAQAPARPARRWPPGRRARPAGDAPRRGASRRGGSRRTSRLPAAPGPAAGSGSRAPVRAAPRLRVRSRAGFRERHVNGFGLKPGESSVDVDISGGLWRGEENKPYMGKIKTPIEFDLIKRISFAPACSAESLTARSSTPVIPEGIHITILQLGGNKGFFG